MRTAPTRSVPRICLSTYPAAPAMIASKSASSSANEVSIRQATSGIFDRRSRHTLDAVAVGQPDVEHGHVRPQRGIRASADSAVAASPMTSISGLGLKQLPDAAPDDLMVVEQEHPDRGTTRC